MKKLVLILGILFATLVSCNKENIFKKESENNDVLYRSNNSYYVENYIDKFENNKQILVFESREAYRDLILKLEELVISHDDNFINEYGYLSDDEMFEKEREVNYSINEPLINFVKEIEFSNSLLFDYLEFENSWLHNDMIESLDPDNIYGLDEEEITLLNSDRAVKIRVNKKEYKVIIVFDEGLIVIEDGDTQILSLLNLSGTFEDAVNSIEDGLNVTYTIDNFDCGDTSNKEKHKCEYANKKRIKGIIKYRPRRKYLLQYPKIVSKTKSFKKSWGVWWRYRTRIKTAIDGEVKLKNVAGSCSEYYYYDKNIHRNENRKSMVKVYIAHPSYDPNLDDLNDPYEYSEFHVFNNKLYGYYYVNGTEIFNQDAYNGDIN